jgi:trimethylamine--corrinoid protein Co-methyltransferase
MQTEYIYPAVGNRMSPKEWNEAGKPLLLDKAIERKNAILARAGCLIDPEIDAIIRSKHKIYFK